MFRKYLISVARNAFEYPLDDTKYAPEDRAIVRGIYKAFEKIDNEYANFAFKGYDIGFPLVAKAGSCALVSINLNGKLFVANLGDSQGVIVRTKDKEGSDTHSGAPKGFDDEFNVYQYEPNAVRMISFL